MANRYLLSFFLTCCFIGIVFLANAQFSGVKWDVLVSSNNDQYRPWFRDAVASKDGGAFVIGGTNGYGGSYWNLYTLYVLKISSSGTIEWKRELVNEDIYINMPVNMGLVLTKDGGVVAAAVTGTLSLQGHHGVDSFFAGDGESKRDVRLIKFSKSGVIEWELFLGGGRTETLGGITIDSAGNILVCGATTSINGDFLGKRRYFFQDSSYTGNFNSFDAFIAKISSEGKLMKIKCYGGSENEILSSMVLNGSNGYLAVGATQSNNLDISGHHGGYDYWINYIDTALNIVHQKCIGDSLNQKLVVIKNKPENRFITSGENIVFTIDSSLNILNEKKGVSITSAGYTDNEGNIYQPKLDTLTKFDSLLNIVWKKKFPKGFGGDDDEFYQVRGDGGNKLYLAGFSSWRCVGCWSFIENKARLLQFSDSFNYIVGKIFYDANRNILYDAGEKLLKGIKIEAKQDTIATALVSGENGIYIFPVDQGNFTLRPVISKPYYNFEPSSISTSFIAAKGQKDTIDFALQPIANKKDLSISLLPLNIARPGFPVQYKLICINQGTVAISNVQVKFLRNPRVNFVSASPVVSTTVGDTLIWNIASLQPFDTSYINLNLRVASPPTVNNTDTLLFKVFAYPFAGDETAIDNEAMLVQNVQGSYDPNDKTETHGGILTEQQLDGNDYLTYLIRFQNTGTNTAFSVMIRDTLENKLDWNSFEMVSSSHPYQLYMIKPHILEFSFPNIQLPDNNANEQASHGFIAYRIKPKTNLSVGDTVMNRAHIYFDYNLPVITNNERTFLRSTVITSVIDLNRPDNQLFLFPNPSNGLVTIFRKGRLTGNANIQIVDVNGKIVHHYNFGQIAVEQFNRSIDINRLAKGLYVVKLQVGQASFLTKFILQ